MMAQFKDARKRHEVAGFESGFVNLMPFGSSRVLRIVIAT